MIRHTVNTITSDALDALYEQLEATEATESQRQLATARAALASATTRAARAETALTRVRAAVHIADDQDVTDWQRGYRACAERAIAALDQPAPVPIRQYPDVLREQAESDDLAVHPPAPAATEATDNQKEN